MKDPFWCHVTKLSDYGGGGGSKRWKCKYCGLEKIGSVTRIKDHLAHVPNKDIGPCDAMPISVSANLEVWRNERMALHNMEEGDASNASTTTAHSTHISSTSSGGPSATRTPLSKGSLEIASAKARLQKQAMEEPTREVTCLFIRCAIPFNVARTNQWKRTSRAISCIGCEWEGPTSETLRIPKLKKEKTCIEGQLLF